MPTHLDVDTIANNREVRDKPIQWTAGMMEVPATDHSLKAKLADSDSRLSASNSQDASANPGRKVISRASRGGF
jgi:hypothetical protein